MTREQDHRYRPASSTWPGRVAGRARRHPNYGITECLRRDYARAGHIPGSRNIPFPDLVDPTSHRYLPVHQLRAAFADVLSEAPERVIAYCGGAIAASSGAFVLHHLGVADVAIYDGSMSEWAADPSLPLVTGD